MAAARSLATDVVARERPTGGPSALLTRVRCSSCAMPVRRSEDTCWSCGIDPAPSAGSDEGHGPDAAPVVVAARSPRRARILGGVLLVAAAVLVSLMFIAQTEDGQGVRGIAARVKGGAWERAGISGASAQFPTPPVRQSVPPRLGLPRAGEALVATGRGVRAELLVAPVADPGMLVDGSAVADELVSGYAATTGGRIVTRTPLYVDGAPGLDAVVEGPAGTVHVRATVDGTTGYLLALAGPTDAFERFTGSFRREL